MLSVRGAGAADLCRLAEAWPLDLWKKCVLQLNMAPVKAAIEDEQRLLAVTGLFPDGDGAEVFCMIGDSLRREPRLALAVIRALRRLRREVPAGMVVTAMVREGHVPGRRLALALGFRPDGMADGLPLERFVWRAPGGRDG